MGRELAWGMGIGRPMDEAVERTSAHGGEVMSVWQDRFRGRLVGYIARLGNKGFLGRDRVAETTLRIKATAMDIGCLRYELLH